jgi:beta-lactamase superfamily II metal-dependent hydrolase
MAFFKKPEPGVLTYAGADYYAVECGGGGNCLFLSFAWLLNHYGVAGGPYVHGALRQQASQQLQNWAPVNANIPVIWDVKTHIFQGFATQNAIGLKLSPQHANALATDRVWGELGAAAALVAWLYAQGRDIEAHVLDGTQRHAHKFRASGAHGKPAAVIHLYFDGYVHYQALVPSTELNTVAASQVVANYADILTGHEPKLGKPTASLQNAKQPSKTTTMTVPKGTVLEIHHIDVGQGDATLIFIKNAAGDIAFSMLIDAGEIQGQVTKYLDTLIGVGNFRPLDALVITHPDKDHLKDAPNLLGNARYSSERAVLYDNGQPPSWDSEYQSYLNSAKRYVRKRPPLDADLLNFMGVNVRCIACNGVMRNGYEPDLSPYWLHSDFGGHGKSLSSEGKLPEFIPNAEKQMQDAFYPTDKNDYSIALFLEFGNFRYFTAGDLSGTYEDDAAYHVNYFYGPVSAWKAGHHGAQTSSWPRTVGYLQGRFCVLSFGSNNQHSHPHQAVIDHLENLNAAKIDCTYYGTGQATQIGKNGVGGKGTIIIRATEAAVATKEAFEVWTAKDQIWQVFECKRPATTNNLIDIAPSDKLGKASKPMSDEKKKEKADRKEQRRNEAAAKLRAALDDFAGRTVSDDTIKEHQKEFDAQVTLVLQASDDDAQAAKSAELLAKKWDIWQVRKKQKR